MANTSNIRMSPEKMMQVASEFNRCGDDFAVVVEHMGTLISGLCEQWKGQSSATFEKYFEELMPSFRKTEQLIHTIATQLREVSQAMQQVDQDIASRIEIR